MAQRTKESVASHVQLELEDLQSATTLPFRQLLDAKRITEALERAGLTWGNLDAVAATSGPGLAGSLWSLGPDSRRISPSS